jgi:hypothetical protein
VVEHRVVAPVVVGSSPITHPILRNCILVVEDAPFCSISRKTMIFATDIHEVFRGRKSESDAEIEQKGVFYAAKIMRP